MVSAIDVVTGPPTTTAPHTALARTTGIIGIAFTGLWRARRGEYCVRYRIDDTGRIVYVLDIDHRRDAYRR